MTERPMRVCIIGSGLSGLSAAFYLTQHENTDVTVYEQADILGGRANVTPDGEHCPRLFLGDYSFLFKILDHVEAAGGVSILDTLQPVRRHSFIEGRGWAQISHLYAAMARELSWPDKLRLLRAGRASPLAAGSGADQNRYASTRNLSPLTMLRIAGSLRGSKAAFALAGPTDECLILPWARALERSGVTFRSSQRVTAICPGPEGVTVRTVKGARGYDAVLATAFAPDLASLLAASGIGHRVRNLAHAHCKCLTLTLDPREAALAGQEPALYSRRGINVLVQPAHQRCVVLCVKSPSTDTAYVTAQVREFLGLRHQILGVRARDNQRADEAIYVADHMRPERVMRPGIRHVYIAGSYTRNTYPIDSAESAARSAYDAVQRMRRDYGLTRCPAAPAEPRQHAGHHRGAGAGRLA